MSTAEIRYEGPLGSEVDAPRMGALVAQCLPDLERFARHLADQAADAQDLVQETCRRALEARAQFADGTNPLAWLRCILRNVYYDDVRQRGRTISSDLEAIAAPAPEDEPLWLWASDDDLCEALASLPEAYRITYERYVLGGERQSQIARDLGVAPGTVGSRVLRARATMRAFLLARLDDRRAISAGTRRSLPAAR